MDPSFAMPTTMNGEEGAGDIAAPTSVTRWRSREIVAVLGVLMVATAVRWHAADHGLSFDEIWMLAGASGHGGDCANRWIPDTLFPTPQSPTALGHAASPGAVWGNSVPFHPPLHAVSLWCWRAIFGGGDWTASMHSATWSIAAIWFVFAAIRLRAGAGAATCVALLLALAPVQVQLGTEVRGYGMMIGLSACAAWQVERMESLGATRRRVWLLGLTLLPLQLTHYFAAGACVAFCLWGLFRLRGPMRRHLVAAVACAAAVGAVIWLPFALEHLQLAGILPMTYLQAYKPFWKGVAPDALRLPVRLLYFTGPSHRIAWVALEVAVLALVVAGAAYRRKVTPWLLLLLVPIAMLTMLDLARGTIHTGFVRYAAAASIGAAAAPILAAFAIRAWLGWSVAAILVGLSVFGLDTPRNIGSPALHRVRTTLLPVISAEPPGLPIACASPDGQDLFAMAALVEWSHAPGFFPRPAMFLQQATPEAIASLADATPERRFWLLAVGGRGLGDVTSDWLRDRLPSARPVRPPVFVPSGHSGVQPEPAAELWLMQFEDGRPGTASPAGE